MSAKAAFITGGSRGIGLSIALTLAKNGFNLALIARSTGELQSAKKQIEALYPESEVLTLSADVTSRDAIQSAFHDAVKIFHQIHVVINNAGIYIPGTNSQSTEEIETLLNTNYKGALWVAQVAMPHFQMMHHGYLINVSSICGLHGFSGTGGYSASKFALMGLNNALFKEFAPKGIKVTAICPSWVDTQMTSSRYSMKSEYSILPPVDTGHMIQPQDIGRTVEYLLSLSPAACPQEIVIECAFE